MNLSTGAATDWQRIDGAVEEMFNVTLLPSVCYPAMIDLKGDEIKRVISAGDWD